MRVEEHSMHTQKHTQNKSKTKCQDPQKRDTETLLVATFQRVFLALITFLSFWSLAVSSRSMSPLTEGSNIHLAVHSVHLGPFGCMQSAEVFFDFSLKAGSVAARRRDEGWLHFHQGYYSNASSFFYFYFSSCQYSSSSHFFRFRFISFGS